MTSSTRSFLIGGMSAVALLLAVACQPATPSATPPPAAAAPKTAVTATAPGAPGTTAPASPTAAPKPVAPAGRLVYAYTPFPSSLDPHNNAGAANGNMLRALYDPLAELQPDGTVQPGLAVSWRNVDPTTWEFKLRPDVKFSNGVPFTADIVKFNIDRIANPANSLQITSLTTLGVTGWSATVVAPDTVRLVTRTPDPVLIRKLNLVLLVPPGDNQALGSSGIGTGTYKVKSYQATNSLVVEPVIPNWRVQPRIAEVGMQFVADASVRAAGLRTGEIGFTTLGADLAIPFGDQPQQFTRIPDLGAASISIEMFPASTEGPLKNLAARQAIQAATNPQQILDALFRGQGKVSQGQLYDPRAFGFDPSLQAPRQDLTRSRSLLAQAGFPNGFDAKLQIIPTSNSIGTDLGQAIQGQLSAVGIRVTLDPVDFATYTQRLLQGTTPDMILAVNEFSATLDAQTVLNNYLWTGSNPNRRFNDPTYNQLMQQAGSEFNEAARRGQLGQAARILLEQQATGYLFQTETQFIYQARYEGFKPAPDLNPRFYNWTIK